MDCNRERAGMLSEEQAQMQMLKIGIVFQMEESDQNAQGDKQIIEDLMKKGSG